MALLKSRDVYIDPSSPWANDPFERRAHGERLLALIRTLREQPYVIALNGDWGTGKSVFLRRLEAQFEGAGPKIPFIRIDAWAADDAADPLVPFAAALHRRLESAKGAKARIQAKLKSAAATLAVPMAAYAATLAAPGAASGVAAAAALGTSLIDWELSRHSTREVFKMALEETRDLLTGRKRGGPLSVPLVIAIDELDRCRPDFAVRALERVKHFFSVPGVVFIIATDRGNLPAAVRSLYGSSVDGELYLRKFFDFEYRLPTPPAKAHVAKLWQDYGMEDVLTSGDDAVMERSFAVGGNYNRLLNEDRSALDSFEYRHYFSLLAETFNLSLRDQSQAFTMLAAHVRTTPRNFVRIPLVDCLFVCLRFANLQAFEDLRIRRLSLNTIDPGYPAQVRSALTTVAAMPEARGLTAFFGNRELHEAVSSLNDQIQRLRSQRELDRAHRIEIFLDRLERQKNASPAYIEALLGLIFAFTPDRGELQTTVNDGQSASDT